MPTDEEILSDESPEAQSAETAAAAPADSVTEAATAPAAAADAAPASAAEETFEPDYGDAAAPAETPAAQAAAASSQTADPEPPTAAAAGDRWGAPALTRLLQQNAKLGELAAADPRLRGTLYAMARRSGELQEMQQVFPTVATAREAAEARDALAQFDRLFFSGSPEQFLSRLYEAQAPNGRSSGAYERIMQYAHGLLLNELEQSAADRGDERLAEAVSAIREALPWAARQQPGEAAHLPAEVRAEIERGRAAQAELSQLRARDAQGREQAESAWLDETAAEAARQTMDYLRKALAPTAFSDFEREAIAERAFRALGELASGDPGHGAALDEEFARGGMTAHTRDLLVGRHVEWAKANARDALEPVLAEANASRRARAAAAAGKRAGWAAEPSGGGAPAVGRADATTAIEQALRKKLGRAPTDFEILDEE